VSCCERGGVAGARGRRTSAERDPRPPGTVEGDLGGSTREGGGPVGPPPVAQVLVLLFAVLVVVCDVDHSGGDTRGGQAAAHTDDHYR
jgi:hypothetical protein